MSENYDSMQTEDMEYSIASQISYNYYDNGNDAEKTQEIQANAGKVESILGDPDGYQALLKFAQSEFSGQNVLFVQAVVL